MTVRQKMEEHIKNWSDEERLIDRRFELRGLNSDRVTLSRTSRPATYEEVLSETDRITRIYDQRLAKVKAEMAGVSNFPQMLAGIERRRIGESRERELFLKYFSLPEITVHWFEDREVGIAGWAVASECRVVRAFLLPLELFKK